MGTGCSHCPRGVKAAVAANGEPLGEVGALETLRGVGAGARAPAWSAASQGTGDSMEILRGEDRQPRPRKPYAACGLSRTGDLDPVAPGMDTRALPWLTALPPMRG